MVWITAASESVVFAEVTATGAGVAVTVATELTVTAIVLQPPVVPQAVIFAGPALNPVSVSMLPLTLACTATALELLEIK